MNDIGFDVSELDNFAKHMVSTARNENPKQVKTFMRKEGSKLRSQVAKNARHRVKKTKKERKNKKFEYFASIKRGKPYKYDGDDAIRAYSYAPQAHLIEDGHRLISHGKEVGFVEGKHVFRDAQREFAPKFARDANDFTETLARDIEKKK